MRKSDEIFYKRLVSIRKELNTYIASRISENEIKTAAFFSGSVPQKKTGSTFNGFLRHMTIKHSCEDAKSVDEEEKCFALQSEEPQAEQKGKPQFPCSAERSSTPKEKVTVSDVLRRDAKYLELDKVLETKEETFSEMLLRMIDEKGLKDSEVYKSANIDRRLFSKIRGDEDYVPSKKTAISFCLALQLEMDEAMKLLAAAGYTLSASSRFDLIIMYLIENCEYNIQFANIVLDDYGEGTLSR